MTYPQEVDAPFLYDLVDGPILVDLSGAFDVRTYDELNGPGHGSLSISLSDPAAAELIPGRVLFVIVDSAPIFAFRIEGNPEYKEIQEGEEHDQILTVQGRGIGSLLEDAIVYPEVELNSRLDTIWRLFSFASPSFPNAGGWAAAAELYEYLDGVAVGKRKQMADDGNLYPSPINFPWPVSPHNYDPDDPPGASYIPTYWIWSESGTGTEEFEIGWTFYRNEFELAEDTIVTFAATADNFFTFYLDGVPIFGEDEDTWMWRGWKEISHPLPAGTYTVAAVAENIGFPGQTGPHPTNPAGFIATIHRLDGDQVPEEVFLVSDDSWVCVFVSNVDRWPGWSPGQIIEQLLDEATARSALADEITWAFTATDDSDANDWLPLDPDVDSPYAASFAVEVGTTAMNALNELHESGWIDWNMRADFTLWVGRGRLPASPTPACEYQAEVNLRSLERCQTAKYANALLVQWDKGYVEVEDAAAITAYDGKVEDIYSADATSPADASMMGRTDLIRRAQEGLPAIVMTIEPTSAADAPYDAYQLGEYVTIPAVGGGTEDVRVLSIAMTQDSEGFASWSLEANRKLRVPERQNADLLRTIGGKSQVVRGRVE